MSSAGVWGLDSGRPGEFRQVETLGRALGIGFARIRLSPENRPVAALPIAPPRLILSFGRSAGAGLALAAACPRGESRPLRVHLGTPGQIPIAAFDLIIPMPQDDYPPAPNVHFLDLPLNGAADRLARPAAGGSCTVIVGGPSRHFRLTGGAIRRLIRFALRLAKANGEALLVVGSPRTPPAQLALLRALRARHGFTLLGYGEAPFAGILQAGARFVVTADSASMLGEACRTGAPVWLFPLPGRAGISGFLQRAADLILGSGFRHRLVRLGWVGGGTDFRRWHRRLERQGRIFIARRLPDAALRRASIGGVADSGLADCRARILRMLQSPPETGPAPVPARDVRGRIKAAFRRT